MNKKAILNKYRILYKACNGILRIKQAVDASSAIVSSADDVLKYDKDRTWGGFTKDIGKSIYDFGKSTIGNTANDAFARKINDDNYNKALKAIEDGTFEGYDPATQEIQGYNVKNINLTGDYNKTLAETEAAKKKGEEGKQQQQIVIQNQMPSQGGGGGGGYAQPGYGVPRQPSLADRMIDYNMQKYSTR